MEILIEDFSVGLMIWDSLLILTIVLWFYSFIDILKAKFKDNNKNVWLLIVLLVPIFGALSYLVFGKKQKLKSL